MNAAKLHFCSRFCGLLVCLFLVVRCFVNQFHPVGCRNKANIFRLRSGFISTLEQSKNADKRTDKELYLIFRQVARKMRIHLVSGASERALACSDLSRRWGIDDTKYTLTQRKKSLTQKRKTFLFKQLLHTLAGMPQNSHEILNKIWAMCLLAPFQVPFQVYIAKDCMKW